MAELHINNISKSYGEFIALSNIDIKIKDGEFLVLIGPSGCGKSTLMNSIAGLESISEGEILMGGKNVTHLAPKDRDIAMVFQSYALYPSMTVYQNIAFALEIRKWPKATIKAEVKRVAELLKIEQLLDRKPAALSGGQRQRVAMGRALAREPEIYLFDEPLSNLDAKLRVQMRTEIKKLHKRLKTTIVYVTHDQIEAMTLADRIAVIKDGKLLQLATPHEIYNDPVNMFVAGFMGSPAMNFIKAKVIHAEQQPFALELYNSHNELEVFPLANAPDLALWVDKELIIGIRPEHIQYNANDTELPTINSIIDVVEPTGADTLITTYFNQQDVTARVSPESMLKAGDCVKLSLDLNRAVFFDPKTEERIK
jgi:multiple sugar transport system ATP-binding protein